MKPVSQVSDSETGDITQILSDLVKGRTRGDVAHALGVTGQAVGQWLSKKKRVSPDNETKIRDLALQPGRCAPPPPRAPSAGSPPSSASTGSEPYRQSQVSRRPAPPERETPEASGDLDGHHTARTLSAYRRAILNYEGAKADLEQMVGAPRERAACRSAATGALRALNATEPTIVKLLASTQWETVVSELEKVLRPHTDVARQVKAIFEHLDAEALADIRAALGPG